MLVRDMTVDQLEAVIRRVVKETLEMDHDDEFTDEFIRETLDARADCQFHTIESLKRELEKDRTVGSCKT